MATNVRVFPPLTPRSNPVIAHGRSYTATVGTYLDVPESDADVLCANGWTFALPRYGAVGPTSARPTRSDAGNNTLAVGTNFIDTTLGAVLAFDGASWRDVTTGTAV